MNMGFYKFGELQADKYLFLMHNCFDKIASIPYMFPKVVNYKNAQRYCVSVVDTIYYNIGDAQIDTITIVGRQNY